MRSRTICWQDYWTTYLKLEHHEGLKNWADELRKLAAANITSHLVLSKKSELSLNDKDVFPQVCIDVFWQGTYFYAAWKEACIRVVWLTLRYSLEHVYRSLTLTMDFSNLWKHCYRFAHPSFHTVWNYTWFTAICSVTVSLHFLPWYLCSAVTCRAPAQWFQINPDCTMK